ncbi:hypothetical protein FJW10_30205 [Mesorhizobium sp. B4-1-1]|nr:hypothetical protein FJW10_30205 [Mesorhizobium sp. B4-1-1]
MDIADPFGARVSIFRAPTMETALYSDFPAVRLHLDRTYRYLRGNDETSRATARPHYCARICLISSFDTFDP